MKDFKSILIGGFECSDQVNVHGHRVNLLLETEHHSRVYEDYQALKSLGIETVREGICWSKVEFSPGCYDFSEVLTRMNAAKELGIQQIWDLIHFGYPDDMYPSHPYFCRRFVALCREFTLFFCANSDEDLHVVPVNEIGFLSWLSGEVAGTVPYARHNGWEIKYRLCEATIMGIKTIREIKPTAQVYMVEPLIWVHAGREEDVDHASRENGYQYQAMDIVMGKICPELGGSPDLVDVLGFNYYWNCQWEINYGTLPWPEESRRRLRLSAILFNCHARFGKPIFLSETGHFGIGRAPWFEEIVFESICAIELGVDLRGVCLYPIVDRPDWDNLSYYHNSGLWDLDYSKNRIIDYPFLVALEENYPLLQQAILKTSIQYQEESSVSLQGL